MAVSRNREWAAEWPEVQLPNRFVAHIVRRGRTGVNTYVPRRGRRARIDDYDRW